MWKNTLFALLVTLTVFVPQNVIAQSYVGNVGRGVFSLTSPTFNCKEFLKSVRRLPVLHIATLYNTFGNDFKCWDKLAADPRLQTVELNLINEPGHRNRRLGKYEFLHGIESPAEYDKLLRAGNPRLKARFVRYVQLAKRKVDSLPANVQCLINPGLESNVSSKAGEVLMEWTKEQFPRCRMVWNPLSATTKSTKLIKGADLVEGHGPTPPLTPACIANLDGTDISFPQRQSPLTEDNIESGSPLMQYIATYANRCELVFLWTVEDNCNFTTKFIDPRARNCKPAGKVFQLVGKEAEKAMKSIRQYTEYSWTEVEEESLRSCTSIKSSSDGFKKGFLLKQSEFRDRGGVVLAPPGVEPQTVDVMSKGRVIDRYRQSGRYDHDNANRRMFRSLTSPVSYPFHVVVRVKTGSELICYKIDNPNERND
jgi:hypothetical protein